MGTKSKAKLGLAIVCGIVVVGLIGVGYALGGHNSVKIQPASSPIESEMARLNPPPNPALPVKTVANVESIYLELKKEPTSTVPVSVPSESHAARQPEELPLETEPVQPPPPPPPPKDGPDYAKLLLKRDYLTEYLIEETDMNEFRELWKRAQDFYGVRSTEKQIYEACERIYQAKQYWPELKARDCLQYLLDRIPDKATISHTEFSTETSAIVADAETQKVASLSDKQKIGVTSVEIDLGNVRRVAEEIYSELEYAYQKPYLDAMQAQEEQRIQQEANNAALEEQIEANRTQRREAGIEAYRVNQAASADAAAIQARRRAEWNANQAEMQRRMGLR